MICIIISQNNWNWKMSKDDLETEIFLKQTRFQQVLTLKVAIAASMFST